MDGPSPWRRVRLDRARALFETWCALDAVAAPEARALADAIVTALGRDRERFSDVLEASIAIAAGGDHAFRFSYALPGFRSAPSAAAATALAAAAPFGPAITAATKRLLRAALDPAVEQPLVGIAWERPLRHKVYLQFTDSAGSAAAALAGRVLGLPWLADSLAGARLHMLGIDFGQDGMTAAKLYVAHDRVVLGEDTQGALSASGARQEVPSAETSFAPPNKKTETTNLPASALALLRTQPRVFRNVLAIHRLGPGAAVLPAVSDVDLGLAENDLAWEDVAAAPGIAGIVRGSRALAAVSSGFRLGVRRLSLSVGSPPRITVYYALREVEEP